MQDEPDFDADHFTGEDEGDRGNPLTAEIDRPNIHREVALDFIGFMFNSMLAIKTYQGEKEFAIDCFLAALGGRGWEIIAPKVKDQTTLANHWGYEKANVSKLVKKFQSYLKLPPAPGQRSLSGCLVMKKNRKKQLLNK